jgi:hypothetical protein
MRKVIIARDVWAGTCRRPSLVEDGRILQWDFRGLLVGSTFARHRVVVVAN